MKLSFVSWTLWTLVTAGFVLRSENLPSLEEQNANPVVKLVGLNHDEVLEDITKDVFVCYHGPYLAHNRGANQLATLWRELGAMYGSNRPDAQVVIAEIDHTANDVQVPQFPGYPTLLMYPAHGVVDGITGLRLPKVYMGQPNLDELIAFVKNEGSLGVDVVAGYDAANHDSESEVSI